MKTIAVFVILNLSVVYSVQAPFYVVGHPKVTECLSQKNISSDVLDDFVKKGKFPEDQTTKCSLSYCLIEIKSIILAEDSRLDYNFIEEKMKEAIGKVESAPPKLLQDSLDCLKSPNAVDYCDGTLEFIKCFRNVGQKYMKPLLLIDEQVLVRCKQENNVTDDEFQKYSKNRELPNSHEGKCMMACILRDKGGVHDETLYSPFLFPKLIYDLNDYDLPESSPTILIEFSSCSPNITDPSGTKDVCDGAYDLYNCLQTTVAKYNNGKQLYTS